MSLEEITEFTEDGCLLEQLQQGNLPAQPVERRLAILRKHEQRLYEQRHQVDRLLDAVNQKMAFYERYLRDQNAKNAEL